MLSHLYHLLYPKQKALTGLLTHLALGLMNHTLCLVCMLLKFESVVNNIEIIIIY